MTEQFETCSKKTRGMARASIDLIQAMSPLRKRRSQSPAGASATNCSPLALLLSWNEMHCRPPLDRAEVVKTVNSIAGIELRRRSNNER